MAKHNLWQDDYWLLLMQLYLRQPAGVKAAYSRGMVALALETHVPPTVLYEKMFALRQIDTPRMEKLWERYGNNPSRLTRTVKRLRQMKGFGQAETFYEGVETAESWETDFKPIENGGGIMPLHLIVILDLYFRLTPITMVAETPEVAELARLMKVPAATVVEVMDVFKFCDPYLNRVDLIITPLLKPCQDVWNRYGSGSPQKLAALASQMKEYFNK